mmetsp:Transcript_28356/g.69056  ORF Transcript_28356/g.69056 Transcript_28356/m.69056 type:complete len:925 (+) Transcript_28356:49-2823(+)
MATAAAGGPSPHPIEDTDVNEDADPTGAPTEGAAPSELKTPLVVPGEAETKGSGGAPVVAGGDLDGEDAHGNEDYDGDEEEDEDEDEDEDQRDDGDAHIEERGDIKEARSKDKDDFITRIKEILQKLHQKFDGEYGAAEGGTDDKWGKLFVLGIVGDVSIADKILGRPAFTLDDTSRKSHSTCLEGYFDSDAYTVAIRLEPESLLSRARNDISGSSSDGQQTFHRYMGWMLGVCNQIVISHAVPRFDASWLRTFKIIQNVFVFIGNSVETPSGSKSKREHLYNCPDLTFAFPVKRPLQVNQIRQIRDALRVQINTLLSHSKLLPLTSREEKKRQRSKGVDNRSTSCFKLTKDFVLLYRNNFESEMIFDTERVGMGKDGFWEVHDSIENSHKYFREKKGRTRNNFSFSGNHWFEFSHKFAERLEKIADISLEPQDPSLEFSHLRSHKAYSAAKRAYMRSLPPMYPQKDHTSRLAGALDIFRRQAAGPQKLWLEKRMILECERVWANRCQCPAVSVTFRPCIRKDGHDIRYQTKKKHKRHHTSNFELFLESVCGRSRIRIRDPFSLEEIATMQGKVNKEAFTRNPEIMSVGLGSDIYSSQEGLDPSDKGFMKSLKGMRWVLTRLGPAGDYDVNAGVNQPGIQADFKHLHLWRPKIPRPLVAYLSDPVLRKSLFAISDLYKPPFREPNEKSNNPATGSAYVGIEYACPKHRIVLPLSSYRIPNEKRNETTGKHKKTIYTDVGFPPMDIPLHTPCLACLNLEGRKAGGERKGRSGGDWRQAKGGRKASSLASTEAQFRRIYVVVPKFGICHSNVEGDSELDSKGSSAPGVGVVVDALIDQGESNIGNGGNLIGKRGVVLSDGYFVISAPPIFYACNKRPDDASEKGSHRFSEKKHEVLSARDRSSLCLRRHSIRLEGMDPVLLDPLQL